MSRVLHIFAAPDFYEFLCPLTSRLSEARLAVELICGGKLGAGELSTDVALERGISPTRDLLAVVQLAVKLGLSQPILVHAHTPKGGLLGMIAAKIARTPQRIYHVHGLRYQTADGFRRLLLKNTEKLSCFLATSVLCVSPSVRDCLLEDGLASPSKVRVLAHGSVAGIDAERFRPSTLSEDTKRPPTLTFVGRLARDKGLKELQQAWPLVREKYPTARLLMAGEHDPTDPFDWKLGEADGVTMLGRVEDTRPVYAQADLIVLPSYREGLGQVLLEAAAMEVPAVATRVTGIVDAVEHRKTGILVPAHDAPALAEAIIELLEDAELRKKYGQAARQHVIEKFDPEPVIQATLELYRELLAEKGL